MVSSSRYPPAVKRGECLSLPFLRHARVIHQNVDARKVLHHPLQQVIHFIGNGKVCDIALSRYALLPQSGCAIGCGGLSHTGQHCSQARQAAWRWQNRYLGAAGTTDQRGFSLQTNKGALLADVSLSLSSTQPL
jgi:hypothetical protein